MLQIRDILAQIWIRGSVPLTNGSVPLTNGSGSGSCYFRQWPSRWQQKIIFLHKDFCLFLFETTFTSFFNVKVIKKSQNSRNQGFSYYFCLMIEGPGSGSVWIRIKETQKHTDPDPQHRWVVPVPTIIKSGLWPLATMWKDRDTNYQQKRYPPVMAGMASINRRWL